MDVIEIIKGFQGDSLMGNGVRSFLTMLGLVIGVASVIMLVSIGEGAKIHHRRRTWQSRNERGDCSAGQNFCQREGFHPPAATTVPKLVYDDALIIQNVPGIFMTQFH